MIKQRRPWPFPGDTALDRSKRVAWSYRDALRTLAPEVCDRLDAQAAELGETWVRPVETDADPDGHYTAGEIARVLHIEAARVRQWGSRGVVPKITTESGTVLYRLRDCIDQLSVARRLAKERA